MSQATGLANAIETVLNQVEHSTIDIGHTSGHYISVGQVTVLREAVSKLRFGSPALANSSLASSSRTSSVPPVHSAIYLARERRAAATLELQTAELSLTSAPREERTELNHRVGQLNSEITRLNKIIPERMQ